MSKFQILCCCLKCKRETTTSQLSKNHKTECPKPIQEVKFKRNFGRTAWNKGLKTKPDLRNPELIGKHGGYRPNAGISKKFKVTDSFGKETTLQSTYELRCSEILNSMNIKWSRPKALKYDNRNYFADFYLPDFDIYLDPKNSYKAKLDKEKIDKVIEQNNVKVLILLEEHLTKEYIARII